MTSLRLSSDDTIRGSGCHDSPRIYPMTAHFAPPLQEMTHAPTRPSAQTLYMPIESPPTPAPSPGPTPIRSIAYPLELASNHLLSTQDPLFRRQILVSILSSCTSSELLFISTTIAPMLKRDFLFWLPTELSLHILTFVDDPKSLVHASRVSKHWHKLVNEECVWRWLCHLHGFEDFDDEYPVPINLKDDFSYRHHYKLSHGIMRSWRHGGSMLQSHRLPIFTSDNGVVTSLALDRDWIVVGLANSKIQIFSARTGILSRTLVGHEMGVWAVCLVSKGGFMAPPPDRDDDLHANRRKKKDVDTLNSAVERLAISSTQEQYISPSLKVALGLDLNEPSWSSSNWSSNRDEENHPQRFEDTFPGKRSDNSFASQGWGQPNSLAVSGGCDKLLRVWDIKTGSVL
jgi:F-box and WD-40 domain protein CDC4